MQNNTILEHDMEYVFQNLSSNEKSKLNGSSFLITGCGGFLGYYFMHFLNRFTKECNIQKVIGLDNFLTGSKNWLRELTANNDKIELHEFNVITDDIADIPNSKHMDYILHLASVASPTFYRKYPIETIDANITGLRRLLDFYKEEDLKGFLFLSSSEIYGDPFPEYIPTSEDYRGNVNTMGPRACYDEAKRFGETICWIYNNTYDIPIRMARPFNNYGPGMNIYDKRLPADFAHAIVYGQDLNILSDGTPTRTFCYISDAITGYFKVLMHDKFDVFNIGIGEPEIPVKMFSELFLKHGVDIWDYQGSIQFAQSSDKDYITDNPNRRCPDISKARNILGYNPTILVEEGVHKYLKFLKINNGELS